SRTGITSFGQLSPAVLAAFIVQYRPKVAPRTRLGFCCHLRVLLRFCYCEGITTRDLSGAVGTPQIYRLNDVPRSITWDDVRRMLEAVERRTIRGRRDYAILLLLVTYGLRAHEVARLTLADVDWKRERLQVLARKAGHAAVYPRLQQGGNRVPEGSRHGRRGGAMNSPIFLSSMAPFLNQFVQYKRALNRKYCADAEVLRLFDRYIQSRQITGWSEINSLVI